MLSAWTFFGAVFQAVAQEPPPQGVSRGENFSNKPAPALFNGDCTGAGCHKGPQGLGKGQSQSGLASFLREHYTNSRESAGALAAYILKLPAGPAQPEPRGARASNPRQGGSGPSWFDPEPSGPGEARTPADARKERQQKQEGAKPARSAARPSDGKPADAKPADAKPAEARATEEPKPESKPESKPSEPAVAAPAEPAAPPAPAPADQRRRTAEPAKPVPVPRNQRGRQPTVAATPAPAEPAPAAAPVAPPPPQYDIFD